MRRWSAIEVLGGSGLNLRFEQNFELIWVNRLKDFLVIEDFDKNAVDSMSSSNYFVVRENFATKAKCIYSETS